MSACVTLKNVAHPLCIGIVSACQPLFAFFLVLWLIIGCEVKKDVEVFHAVAPTAEHGEYGTYNLTVLIAYQRAANS